MFSLDRCMLFKEWIKIATGRSRVEIATNRFLFILKLSLKETIKLSVFRYNVTRDAISE